MSDIVEQTESVEENITAKLHLDPRLIEAVAEFEHEQWMAWARNIVDKEPGLSEERKERWRKLFVPYSELSEEMKDADREWARAVGKIFLMAVIGGVFAVSQEIPENIKS